MVTEYSGYSTVFDALFLLVLISLAGVLLMPSMQAEKQYSAAGYVTSSELDIYLLESLLSCKLEDFEYEISPLSALNISTPENSVVENPSHTLFAKEQKHRTFADLTAEYLALSLKISSNEFSLGPSFSLNPLAEDYSFQEAEAISAYLDQKAAGRFSYRFEAYWHPVEVFPMQSELIIGEEPPANAIRQSTKLSMPLYASTPSKDVLLACVNDSVLEASLNSSDEEAARCSSRLLMLLLMLQPRKAQRQFLDCFFHRIISGRFLGKKLRSLSRHLLYGVSENPEKNSRLRRKNFCGIFFRICLKPDFRLDSGDFPENPSTDDFSLLEELMADYIKNEIRSRT